MQNNSESGFFTPRIVVAFLMLLAAGGLAVMSFAVPSPATGTLSTSNRTITYNDPVGSPPNPTGFALGNPNCGPSDTACSVFNLTIDPSVGTAAAGYDPTKYQITVQWAWAVSAIDNDVFIKNASGTVIAKNQSTADPSTIILPTNTPPGVYKLVLVLSTGAPIAYTGTVRLEPIPPGPGPCDPNLADCTPPRFQSFPAGAGQADDAGEPSIGVDWNPNVKALQHDKVNTGGVAFFTSSNHEWRVSFDDCASPAIYDWTDVSAVFDQTAPLADPIGFVDHYSNVELGLTYPPPFTPGRVFCLQLVGGQGNSLGAYSDNDGNSYLPGANGGPGQGPDHETLGAGPYSGTPPVTASYPATGAKHATYYCSQNIVAEAQCSRSDDGGQTFGPGIPIFTPTQCTGGTTGHVKVAPDGTVYVANSTCGTVGTTGVAVSVDNGMTWIENNIPNSTSSQDPYVAIGQNNVGKANGQSTNTIYLAYVDGNNHPKVAFSHDRGVTWSSPVDLGSSFGITHAVFPIAAAGDDNRAAVGFLGTGDGIATSGTCDPYGATLNCANMWHLYVATTYDGGQSWITVDATPQDPVQTGTICLQGTTCLGGRNLADFNDMGIDSQGRILVGFADGCVNCNNTFAGQSNSAHGTVSRQSGGRRLFHAFDPVEPAVPGAPQLISAVSQATGGTLITWAEPDNGGSPITGYKVYRGAASNTETFLAQVTGETTTKYLDAAPGSTNAFYYVQAVNGLGESGHCREVTTSIVVPTGNSCAAPYLQVQGAAASANDPTGQYSIQNVNIGEPFTSCNVKTLTGVLKTNTMDPTGAGQAAPPPDSAWRIQFQIPGTANSTGQPQTIFLSYDTTVNPAGAADYGWIDPATGSACNQCLAGAVACNNTVTVAPDGTINMSFDLSSQVTFGTCASTGGSNMTIDPGQWTAGEQLTKIQGLTFQRIGGVLNGVTVTKAQTTGDGAYTLKGNVSCQGLLPDAVLTASPLSGSPPLNVHFDASGSKEPTGACGSINSYTIDFGDGSPPVTQTSPTFSHTYSSSGDFPARLKVGDTAGQVSTNPASVIISVAGNTPPTADLRANPTSGNSPLTVHFDATHSTDPDNQDAVVSYTYRFGDGTPDLKTGQPLVDHTYTTAGSFAARLTVTDSRGADSENTAEQVITINAPASPTPTATATASPTASPTATASPTPTATATPTSTPVNVQLLNISGRVFTQSGDKVGIGGFIISGSSSKRIMARAIGPSLKVNGAPLQGRLQDPVLEIHDSNGSPALINDNWRDSQEAEIQQSGLAPGDNKESAVIKRLDPGNYTAIIRGADGSPGIGVVELYDLSSSDPSELGNLSVRADVQTGDNVLFNGIIMNGGTPKRVLFRAIGPSIKVNGAPLAGRLQDPTLELHDANGVVLQTNDNWQDAPNKAEIQATGLAPTDPAESAILLSLQSGNYTSIVRGKNGTTGIALGETYKLNN